MLDIPDTRETRAQTLAATRARVVEGRLAQEHAAEPEATPTVLEDATPAADPVPAVDADAPQVAPEPAPAPKVEPKPAPAKKSRGPVKPSDEIVALARTIRSDVEIVVKCNADPVEAEYIYMQLGSPDVTAANVDAFASHLRELAAGHEVKSLRPVEFYGAIAKKSSEWAKKVSKA
jgi:hypothetical protein